MARFVTVLSVVLLSACAASEPTRLDTTDDMSFARSLGEMQRQLSPQENCMLLNAITRVSIGENEQAKLTGVRNDVNALVKGLTYAEILALSQRYPDKASRPCN